MPGTEEIAHKDLGVIRGFNVRAYIEYDEDTKPEHSECYSPEDIKAWDRNEWFFVETVIEASLLGIVLGTAYLGGSEYGESPGWGGKDLNPLDGEGDQFVNGCGPDLINEAIAQAELTMGRLIDERTKLLTQAIQMPANGN